MHTRRLDELQLEREQPRLELVLLLEQSSHLRREGRLVQRLVIVRRVRLAWLLARRARTCDARTCGGAFARRCLGRQAGWGRETTTKRFFSVVRRGELTAAYVVQPDGRTLLRQLRVGEAADGQVEVLAGLAEGERVALDPLQTARP